MSTNLIRNNIFINDIDFGLFLLSAQRNSDSNASSMQSVDEVPTPKKNKMKDKVKKQLKKAKHTLHIKKKEDPEDGKNKSTSKEHKTKWF